MATSQDAQTLVSTEIPALGAQWRVWADRQIAAAQAAAGAQVTVLQAQVTDLQAQLAKANEGLDQTVGDHNDDVSVIRGALAAAAPPAA